jgi:hypothetical protein
MYRSYAQFGNVCTPNTIAFTSNNKYLFNTDPSINTNYIKDYSYCGTQCYDVKIMKNNYENLNNPTIVYRSPETTQELYINNKQKGCNC